MTATTGTGRARGTGSRRRLGEGVATALVLVAFFAAWIVIVEIGDFSPLVLPGPLAVGEALVELFVSGFIWPHLGVTLSETVLGFLAGSALGLGLAILLTQVPALMRVLNIYIVATQAAPKLALAPLFAVWFGFGILSKVVITALVAFFPLFENAVRGLKSADADYEELFTMMKANRFQRFLHLQVPSAAPYLFTGARVAIVLSVVGAVVGEYVGSNQGLGALVIATQGNFRTDQMFAVIFILTAIGILLYALVEVAELAYDRWTYRARRV